MRALADTHRLRIHYITKDMKALFVFIIGLGLALTSYGGSTNQTTSPDSVISREYHVNTNTFVAHLKHLLPPKTEGTGTQLVIQFLREKHVEIKFPEAVWLNEAKGVLFVRATPADQDRIEKLVEQIISEKSASAS